MTEQNKATGWVRIYRSVLDDEILAEDNTAAILFFRLLLLVDRNTGSWRLSRNKFAATNNMKPSTCYKALKRLEAAGMIQLTPHDNFTVVTICNYTTYQDKKQGVTVTSQEQQRNSKGTTSDQSKSSVQEQDSVTSGNAQEHYNKKEKKNKTNTYEVVFNSLAAVIQPKARFVPNYEAKLKVALKSYTADELVLAAQFFAHQWTAKVSTWHTLEENKHFRSMEQFLGKKDGTPRYTINYDKAVATEFKPTTDRKQELEALKPKLSQNRAELNANLAKLSNTGDK